MFWVRSLETSGLNAENKATKRHVCTALFKVQTEHWNSWMLMVATWFLIQPKICVTYSGFIIQAHYAHRSNTQYEFAKWRRRHIWLKINLSILQSWTAHEHSLHSVKNISVSTGTLSLKFLAFSVPIPCFFPTLPKMYFFDISQKSLLFPHHFLTRSLLHTFFFYCIRIKRVEWWDDEGVNRKTRGIEPGFW